MSASFDDSRFHATNGSFKSIVGHGPEGSGRYGSGKSFRTTTSKSSDDDQSERLEPTRINCGVKPAKGRARLGSFDDEFTAAQSTRDDDEDASKEKFSIASPKTSPAQIAVEMTPEAQGFQLGLGSMSS